MSTEKEREERERELIRYLLKNRLCRSVPQILVLMYVSVTFYIPEIAYLVVSGIRTLMFHSSIVCISIYLASIFGNFVPACTVLVFNLINFIRFTEIYRLEQSK